MRSIDGDFCNLLYSGEPEIDKQYKGKSLSETNKGDILDNL